MNNRKNTFCARFFEKNITYLKKNSIQMVVKKIFFIKICNRKFNTSLKHENDLHTVSISKYSFMNIGTKNNGMTANSAETYTCM